MSEHQEKKIPTEKDKIQAHQSDKKLALITGASRGIGRACALELAAQGYNLALVYYSNIQAAEEVKNFCCTINREIDVIILQGDVGNPEQCQLIFDQVKKTFGRIDVLVNNAGQTKDGLAMRMTYEQFNDIIQVNLTSAFMLSKLCLSLMSRQRNGSIINITSVAGIYGNAGQANYAAAKAGLIGLTKSLSKEMGGRNITVNAVAPGFIETDMTKDLPETIMEQAKEKTALKRLGKAEDVAYMVSFLASEKARYITGQVIEVSGGLVL